MTLRLNAWIIRRSNRIVRRRRGGACWAVIEPGCGQPVELFLLHDV
jgi:hypothetical protein